MNEAVELFHSESYSEAEKIFLKLGESAPIDAFKYLYLISKKLNRPNKFDRYNKYLKSLALLKNWEEYFEFHSTHNEKLSFENKINYIHCLWDRAMVDKFVNEARSLCIEIVDRKLYSKAMDVFTIIDAYNPNLLFNKFFYLQYLIESSQYEKAASVVEQTKDLILHNWKRIRTKASDKSETLKKLYDIASPAQEESDKLLKQTILLRRELFKEMSTRPSSRYLLEYLLVFKDSAKELVELIQGGFAGSYEAQIKTYIKTNSELKEQLKDLPRSYRLDVDETIIPKITIAQAKTIESNELDLDSTIHSVQKLEVKKTKNLNETLTLSEKEIVEQIESRDPNLFELEPQAVVQSLVSVGFYRAALLFIGKLEVSQRLMYLKCFCLQEIGDYKALVRECDRCIKEFSKDSDAKIAFLYFRAQAYLNLGKAKKAQKDLEEIINVDPDFRNTKELLDNAKAQ